MIEFIKMLGFSGLLLNFFLGLYFLIPSLSFDVHSLSADSQNFTLSHSKKNEKSSLKYSDFIIYEVFINLGASEYIYNKSVSKIEIFNHLIYNSKLLYLVHCKFIEPNLSSTLIIFPFHCFT